MIFGCRSHLPTINIWPCGHLQKHPRRYLESIQRIIVVYRNFQVGCVGMRKSLISIANARMLFGRALFRSIGITHARRSMHYGRDVSFQSRNRGCSLFNCRRRNLVFKQEAKQVSTHLHSAHAA